MIATYQKRPVQVKALQWTGQNRHEIEAFCGYDKVEFKWDENEGDHSIFLHLFIKTLEGTMEASQTDYIIQGVQGEFYPCKEDIFLQTYERIH